MNTTNNFPQFNHLLLLEVTSINDLGHALSLQQGQDRMLLGKPIQKETA